MSRQRKPVEAVVQSLSERVDQFRDEARAKGDTIRELRARIEELEARAQAPAEVIERAQKKLEEARRTSALPESQERHVKAYRAAHTALRGVVHDLLAAVEADEERLTREEYWRELREAIETAVVAALREHQAREEAPS